MFCSRSVALRKLGLPPKIFDWFCFFNGITSFCPRKKKRGKNSTYFSLKKIQKISKDESLIKIKHLFLWRKLNQKSKGDFHKKMIEIPRYNFFKIIKKRFSNFNKAISFFLKLLPFFILEKKFTEHFSVSPNFYQEIYFFSSKCRYFVGNLESYTNLEKKKKKIELEIILMNERKKINFPYQKLRLKGKGKKFQLSLTEFYINFVNLVLSKLFWIQNFSFLNFSYYFLEGISQTTLNCPNRFYTQTKIKRIKKNLSPFISQIKNWALFGEFNPKIKGRGVEGFKTWIFSRNYLFPRFVWTKEKFVFFSENLKVEKISKQILLGNKVSLKTDSNITFFLSQVNNPIRSIITQSTGRSWLLESIMTESVLPTIFYQNFRNPKKNFLVKSRQNVIKNLISFNKNQRIGMSSRVFYSKERKFSLFFIVQIKTVYSGKPPPGRPYPALCLMKIQDFLKKKS